MCIVQQLVVFVNPAEQSTLLPDLSSCSRLWNLFPLSHTWPGTCMRAALSAWRHGREAAESLLQQRRSCYFTINVKPLLFVIGNTRRPRCCRCCCHILICSPLWKTPASINFAFMVCTHNKWAWGVVVYQPPVLLSNLLGRKIYIYKGECVWTLAIFRIWPLIYVLSKTI